MGGRELYIGRKYHWRLASGEAFPSQPPVEMLLHWTGTISTGGWHSQPPVVLPAYITLPPGTHSLPPPDQLLFQPPLAIRRYFGGPDFPKRGEVFIFISWKEIG